MSFTEQDDRLLGISEEEDRDAMDTEILDSSGHNGEQDRLVDETTPKQESTPKVTNTATAVEQMDSSPGVAEAAKAVDKDVAEAGKENLDLQESPEELMTTGDKVVTLSESNEVKDIADREAAMALSGGHLGKSPQEVARLAQVALDQMEDLDSYLDLFMTDQTMSIAKAKKSGDVVVIVPCPHGDHTVCLAEGKGFFIVTWQTWPERPGTSN
jgi:hypothetical protein